MVIARFASHPVAANAANDPTSLPAYRAVAEHLMATDKTPLLGNASQLTPTGIFFVGNLCARFLTTLGKWRSVRLGGSTK